MTESDKTIVKALIAVAWADGQMEESESSVIDGLLAGFDASPDEERELGAYAKVRRALEDVRIEGLSRDDRELLLGNAALLTHADGDQSPDEERVLLRLSALLGFDEKDAFEIVESVRGGALADP
jgi:tellurite resistance protein